MKRQIDFDFINKKIESGLKFRFDIGLSGDMPYSKNWVTTRDDVFVICIEPHPSNFSKCLGIRQRTENSDNLYMIEAAVDNVESPCKKVFYGYSGPATNYDAGTSSLHLPKGRFEGSVDIEIEVDAIPLSYILDNIKYDKIELIKTDTQGNDLNVLKSLKDHISNVVYVDAEYDESADYLEANTGKQTDEYMKSKNFTPYQYYTCRSRNIVSDARYKNNLFDSDITYSNASLHPYVDNP